MKILTRMMCLNSSCIVGSIPAACYVRISVPGKITDISQLRPKVKEVLSCIFRFLNSNSCSSKTFLFHTALLVITLKKTKNGSVRCIPFVDMTFNILKTIHDSETIIDSTHQIFKSYLKSVYLKSVDSDEA